MMSYVGERVKATAQKSSNTPTKGYVSSLTVEDMLSVISDFDRAALIENGIETAADLFYVLDAGFARGVGELGHALRKSELLAEMHVRRACMQDCPGLLNNLTVQLKTILRSNLPIRHKDCYVVFGETVGELSVWAVRYGYMPRKIFCCKADPDMRLYLRTAAHAAADSLFLEFHPAENPYMEAKKLSGALAATA